MRVQLAGARGASSQLSTFNLMSKDFNPKTTAVVLLELQNDFLSEGGKLHPLLKQVLEANNVVENLNKLISGARERSMTIVQTPIQFSADYKEMGSEPYGILKAVKDAGAFVRGSWGANIAPSINLQESDIIINGKSSIDAFTGTNLDEVLRSRDITTIALAGQLTNICIESTMRAAYDRGYEVYGITDASATIGLEQYEISVRHNWPMFSKAMSHVEFLEL